MMAATTAAPKAKKPREKKDKIQLGHARGKRKESIARATVRKGKGNVRVNSMSVTAFSNRYVRDIILEPLKLSGDIANAVDVEVHVRGGGEMGQAQACRNAIARALVEFSGDSSLKDKLSSHDKFLLSEDVRRVEPKKYKGPKARARFQKSYR
jgi:small subunit ribosomal protein S9